jgi:hypothetical protein
MWIDIEDVIRGRLIARISSPTHTLRTHGKGTDAGQYVYLARVIWFLENVR